MVTIARHLLRSLVATSSLPANSLVIQLFYQDFTMVCSVGELHLKGNATFIEDWQDLKVRISKFLDIVLLLRLCNLVCFDSVAW